MPGLIKYSPLTNTLPPLHCESIGSVSIQGESSQIGHILRQVFSQGSSFQFGAEVQVQRPQVEEAKVTEALACQGTT